jgi:superfamily II helicase
MSDLSPKMRERLESREIEELFPVQSAVYNLFVNGRELIVK